MRTASTLWAAFPALLLVCAPERAPRQDRDPVRVARAALNDLLDQEERYLNLLGDVVSKATRVPREKRREILARIAVDREANKALRARARRARDTDELKTILGDLWSAIETHRNAMLAAAPDHFPQLAQREEFQELLRPLRDAYVASRPHLSESDVDRNVADRPAGERVRFSVDLSKARSERAEDVLRTSVVAYTHENIPGTIWEKFFAEQRVGDVLLDVGDDFIASKDLEDLKSRLGKSDDLVRRIIAAGGRVQIMIGSAVMPRWLSSQPRNEGDLFPGGLSEGVKIWHSVPPSDYGKWREVAKAVVRHFNVELATGGRVYYIIGNEPDNYWVGTEEEHQELYRHFVLGALDADRNARVGGITPAQYDAKVFTKFDPRATDGGVAFRELAARDGRSILYNWIAFCRRNDLPIHFVTWHQYPAASPTPADGTLWLLAEQEIEGWLSEHGYSGVELVLNDWPEWAPQPDENDSEFKAAYVAAGVLGMVQEGRTRLVYLGLRDQSAYTDANRARENGSFGGGTGLVTIPGVVKPVFNAYTLIGRTKGRIVNVETGDELLHAVAAVDGDTVYVLLSNFIPSRRIMPRNTFGSGKAALDEADRQELLRSLQSQGWDRERLVEGVLDGSVDVAKLGLPRELARRLEGLQRVAVRAQARSSAALPVSFVLEGLGRGRRYRLVEYAVDDARANAYAIRKDIAEEVRLHAGTRNRESAQRILRDVNRRAGVESGKLREVRVASDGPKLEVELTMRPNAVHLLVLEPSSDAPSR